MLNRFLCKIKRIGSGMVFVGIRVDVEEEIIGLDESQHGERAYNL